MKTYKAPAKVNIFLKITGRRGDYHEIFSRFMLVDNLFDTISFFPKDEDGFIIKGNFDCKTEQNTIYKAYEALLGTIKNPDDLRSLMRSHGIAVGKRIPSFAGLGGGSSDAATYLKMCNEVLHLGLTADELSAIGSKVGADVAFFIHNYPSANVSGIGEIVEPFDEEPLPLEIITPKIKISTPDVYRRFRENFYTELDTGEAARLSRMDSKTILQNYTISEANDLFEPAVSLYPELKSAYKHGWFFSGSGSSFFKIKDKEKTNEPSA